MSTFSHKFYDLQVPNGTKDGSFGVVSQVEKVGLVGYQNFFEGSSMAHLKAIAHFFALFFSPTIRKCHIELRTANFVPPLN